MVKAQTGLLNFLTNKQIDGIRELINHPSPNLNTAIDILGLDISKHFRNANLTGIDFNGVDISGIDFRGADLTDCLWEGVIRSENATFDPDNTPYSQFNSARLSKNELLLESSFLGNTSGVQSALEGGADINCHSLETGFCPLALASNAGHSNIVSTLLDRGAMANMRIETEPAKITPYLDKETISYPMVDTLVEKIKERYTAEFGSFSDSEPMKLSTTPLHEAIRNGHLDVVEGHQALEMEIAEHIRTLEQEK